MYALAAAASVVAILAVAVATRAAPEVREPAPVPEPG
jgi:hypothetical protein